VKRVLLDECLPKKLRRFLPEFEVQTVQQAGWSSLKNGELLAAIPGKFEVFLSVDSNIVYQQNLKDLTFAVVIVTLPQNRLEHFLPLLPQLREALETCKAGDILHLRTSKAAG